MSKGSRTYTNDDVQECRLENWGKPRDDGSQEQRYKVFFKDGGSRWLSRVTSILKVVGKDFKQWAVDRGVDYLAEQWQPGVPYSEAQISNLLNGNSELEIVGARWAHRQKLKQAGDYGTIVHNFVEAFLKTGVWVSKEVWEKQPPEVQNALDLFIEWWNECEFTKPIRVEAYVYDVEWGYGGKLDYLAEDKKGNYHVLDWKTSGGIYWDYLLQVSAYVNGLFVAQGVTVESAHIIRFGKTGLLPQSFKISKDNLREAWRGFTYCVDLYRLRNKLSNLCSKARDEHKRKEEEEQAAREARANEPKLDEKDVKESWRRFVREAKRIDTKTAAVLADCRPGGWSNEAAWCIEIPHGYEWHFKQLHGNVNLPKISEQVFGRRVAISLRHYKQDEERQSA